jgi:hypothetical protein
MAWKSDASVLNGSVALALAGVVPVDDEVVPEEPAPDELAVDEVPEALDVPLDAELELEDAPLPKSDCRNLRIEEPEEWSP